MNKHAVSIELTPFELRRLQGLSKILWPDELLRDAELVRRLALIGADGLAGGQCQDWEHLLPDKDLPALPLEVSKIP